MVLLAGPVPLSTLEELVEKYNGTEDGEGDDESKSKRRKTDQRSERDDSAFIESMTFANWCKCCVVPGTCPPGA